MFARSASIALVALLSLHGIDLVDARVGAAGTTGILDAFRASQATGSPTSSPVSPAPTLPVPTGSPSDSPAPSPAPSGSPTVKPPTTSPSGSPAPSPSPSSSPTLSRAPTPLPTSGPPTTSPVVTDAPSDTQQPSPSPSGSPSTPMPTTTPSDSPQPSPSPTRNTPTDVPTKTLAPSETPTVTAAPSPAPSSEPSERGSEAPSKSPAPTGNPTSSPKPSPQPSMKPTTSKMPTPGPTNVPTVSNEPSKTIVPSITTVPSLEPSFSSEPSISDVPSAVPSESEEPSISDVPTTSANPTADNDSYVSVTVTYYGDSMFAVAAATATGTTITCTNSDGSPLTIPTPTTGNLGFFTFEFVCPAGNYQDGEFFDLTLTQTKTPPGAPVPPALPGTDTLYPYTVDFKVDGETVPELSGEMEAVEGALFSGTDGIRNFRFTNEFAPAPAPGAVIRSAGVTDTELDPAKKGDFLQFTLPTPGTNTIEVQVLSEPLAINGGTASCGFSALTTVGAATECPFYADNMNGDGVYIFLLNIQGATAIDEFHVDVTSNGVVVPGGPHSAALTTTNELFQVLAYRAATGDGPLVRLNANAAFELVATWTGDGSGNTVDLSIGTDPVANCQDSAAFDCPNGEVCNVSIFCPTVAATPGDPAIFNAASNGLSVTYEFFYDGILFPDLSITSATDPIFSFDSPASFGAPPTQTSGVDFIV